MTNRPSYELAAEFIVLTFFDELRARAGHDYGAGQRKSELMRRGRELRDLHGIASWALDESNADEAELAAAAARLLGPRLRRITGAESYRRHTPASQRTERALRRTIEHFGATSVERFGR